MASRGSMKFLSKLRGVSACSRAFSSVSTNHNVTVFSLTPCIGCSKQQVSFRYLTTFSGFKPRYRFLSSSKDQGSKIDATKVSAPTVASTTDIGEQLKNDVSSTAASAATVKLTVRPRPRPKTDFTQSYTANIFITAYRAMDEYLLTSGDLNNLKSAKRRSPYPEMQDMTVYLRRDVEQVAIGRYGSLEKLTDERMRRIAQGKRQMPSRQWEKLSKKYELKLERESLMKSASGKVVLLAVTINAANMIMKFIAWQYTGSHSMFAECIHSTADTLNQIILALGIHQSLKKPDMEHPYGWANFRPVACLISGVGIFCLGAGLSWYHGIMGLLEPHPVESLFWAIAIMGGSFMSEGATLLVAAHEVRASAKREGMTASQYVLQGLDPSTSVVLLEDLAAVMGVVVASCCMGITHYWQNPMADAVGSLLVGTLLAGVASVIIYTNTVALVGKSIQPQKRRHMMQFLENDRMIRAVHDVKATDMGGASIRFKAEVDFDGREMARFYLEKQDIEIILKDMQEVKTIEDVELLMLTHGENVVDSIGAEVDRIEKNLKKKYPQIKHVDLVQL